MPRPRLPAPESLAARLAWASALLVVVSIAVLSLLTVSASRSSLREHVLAANLTAATLLARTVEAYVADAVSIAVEATGRPKLRHEIASRNWGEATRVLENVRRHFEKFEYLFVQSPDGIIRARVPAASTIGRDFSHRPFFQEAARTRRPFVSDAYVSEALGRPVVSIAAPVLDGDVLLGVFVGALSLDAMSRFVAAIGPEDGGHAYIVDRKGLLVAHSRRPRTAALADLSAQPVVRAVMAGGSGTLEFEDPEGAGPLLSAYVPIPGLGWGVVAAKPASAARAAVSRLVRWLVAAAVACTLVAVLLAWRFARTLTGPLSRIAAASERLATGNLDARTGLPGGAGEVGQLARAFDRMAAALERRRSEAERAAAEVRRLNAELERRVADRTAQLEALNRELGDFTYTVSHDLKAPLRGMEGYARAVLEDYGDRLDETGRRYLGTIGSAARRLGELIDDLLRYSRLERREMRWQSVPLRPLLEELRAELEPEIQARRLTVRWDLGVDTVQGEREGLREALANLVSNAVKFSRRDGGTITLGARRVDDAVVLSVGDEGIGFDMKYHDRIFRIFERLQRDEEYPGTGVGLAIVRKVAERHGGRAWAESQPGRGSTFHLALPANSHPGATS
jgi:signal transduction histidine kinase